MVLCDSDYYLIAGTKVLASPTVGHQVYRLGGIAGKDDRVRVGGVEEPRYLEPSTLIEIAGLDCQCVGTAVNVGVVVVVIIDHRFDDLPRLLGRGGIIEVNKRMAVDFPLQDGKVAAQPSWVECAFERLHGASVSSLGMIPRSLASVLPASVRAMPPKSGRCDGRTLHCRVVLRSLTQINFRNLATPKLETCAGLTAIFGSNAAGKSNLLEACYLGLTGELPGGKIAENVRIGEEQGFVGTLLDHDDGSSSIEVGLSPGRKTLKLDGHTARVVDISRISAAVLITPEDAELVHGSPSQRRAYLDSLLGRLSPRYSVVSRAFARVLEQRNAALRSGFDDTGVEVWSDRFVELGQEIDELRERAVVRIAELAAAAYQAIAGSATHLSVGLQRSWEGSLAEALRESRHEERARGTTVVGPQRSDLRLELDGHSAQAYASRGEARTVALALRVAEFRLLEQRHEETPVLLLDDFSAELDPSRRAYLLQLVRAANQALVTGTEPPPEYDSLLRIEGGAVSHG